nr:immunoglobulin heavy chain junction region [Macaca mulatta]MOW92287.1 immunoglobulin heavy chain junction region [Macaca mulatta]
CTAMPLYYYGSDHYESAFDYW